MSHKLRMFEPTISSLDDDYDIGFIILFGLIVSLIGFIFLILEAPVVALGLAAFTSVIFLLWITHENRFMDSDERKMWKRYKSLPPDLKATIPLTGKTIKALGATDDWHAINRALLDLNDVHQLRIKEELKHEGRFAEIRNALLAAAEEEQERLKIAYSVTSELKEKELI